jgi:flagellar export protein FliJ
MPFRYPLQSILRLRGSLERQAEQRLFVLAGHVIRLRAEIEDLERSELERKRSVNIDMREGAFAATLQYVEICAQAVREKREELQLKMVAAEHERLAQFSVYLQARQKREILSRLREQQKSEYEREVIRREQQSADETHLLHTFFEPKD